ncbi:putative amidohydrolase [Methanofollis sp. W23]|uniref:carbon-nitrogen hydrolase family protein n=1 Tax=Methanofollis sp. W23 TaxID=2817849 RepID=UPI001AEB174E|nr:carbon-nitrogen hydrolase family protein [Methanofollis sp. W23]MBP2144695.1 putative amidohydrolase [Methanofollis sp. W23]
MKICCAEVETGVTVAESLVHAARCIAAAARAGADLVLFPEQFATGWSPVHPVAAPSLLPALAESAAGHGVWVVGSSMEGEEMPQNTAWAVGPDGEVHARYAKVHLFTPLGEDQTCSAGDRPAVFDAGGVRFGLAICYDLRFPELFLHYAGCGVECILVPAAWPRERRSQWAVLARARALDAGCYLAGANAYGGSCIVAPDGDQIGERRGRIVYGALDPSRVAGMRASIPIMRDRRPALYAQWEDRR